jgi:phospholipid-transporting ATPase
MLVVACTAAAYNVVWSKKSPNYLGMPPNQSPVSLFFQVFGTWILLFTNMIPISLLVTIEIVHFAQAIFIGFDAEIYSIEKDMPTKV